MEWKSNLITGLQWSDRIINREGKERIARELAAQVKDGEVIGAGSGSTVYLTLFAIAERIRTEKLQVRVIPAFRKQLFGRGVPIGHSTVPMR